jgi:16S rRNA C967 or C1407 C5-methylase (RsmB/RsmF family)/NOL1/NOP2/fmu family ribosome biogenesis protein
MPLPPALLQSLKQVKGFDEDAFVKVHASGEQVTSIRLNPVKSFIVHGPWSMDDSVPWCPHGLYLSQRPSFTLDPSFHAGAYYVQEASSMFVWHALQETIGSATQKKVLDLCAAPGGKSTLLASYFTDGLVVANEVIKSRAAVLVENITKWGNDHVIVTNNDPSHFQSLPGYFDVVMIDAPCSGSGLFRKDPGAINEWSEDNVQLCSQRQQRILADVLPALKEDGILIYSTCSYSAEEDESVADWLVTERNMENKKLNVPAEWNIVESVSAKGAYGYRFYPDKIKGEGFFLSVFQKKESITQARLKEQSLTALSRSELQQVNAFITLPETFTLFKQAESVRAIKKEWFTDLQLLAKCLYIKKAGVEIGTIKGKDLIPAHELALSTLPKENFSSVALTLEQALQYLRRKELLITNASKGWNLMQYGGLPLGWVKVLPNRINNYYPAEWRILKE